MSETSIAHSPRVLTGEGRAWLQARLDAAHARLDRVARHLDDEHTPDLLAERQQIEEHIEELSSALRVAVAPGEISDDPELVELGDEVQVRFPDGSVETFLVVDPLEAGMDERRTSAESPLGRAVLGHRVGDRVTVAAPAGVFSCTILERRRLT